MCIPGKLDRGLRIYAGKRSSWNLLGLAGALASVAPRWLHPRFALWCPCTLVPTLESDVRKAEHPQLFLESHSCTPRALSNVDM